MTEQDGHGNELSLPLLNHPLDAPTAVWKRPNSDIEQKRSFNALPQNQKA
jgi:hypothetical protein